MSYAGLWDIAQLLQLLSHFLLKVVTTFLRDSFLNAVLIGIQDVMLHNINAIPR